jgi:adenylate kinase
MKQDSTQAGKTRGAALLLGPPGSGKTTLADAVADHEDMAALEAGALLRARLRADEELSRRLKPYLEKGEMAPVDLVEPVLADRLRELSERHVLFDGFPRTEEQIAPFFALLRDHELHLRSVVVLSLSVEESIKRLSARRVCPKCGAVFNTLSAPPKRPGRCDRCGAALSRREDDEPDVVRRRFDVYERQTGPVVAFFHREHPRLTYTQTGSVKVSQAANRIKGEVTKP